VCRDITARKREEGDFSKRPQKKKTSHWGKPFRSTRVWATQPQKDQGRFISRVAVRRIKDFLTLERGEKRMGRLRLLGSVQKGGLSREKATAEATGAVIKSTRGVDPREEGIHQKYHGVEDGRGKALKGEGANEKGKGQFWKNYTE